MRKLLAVGLFTYLTASSSLSYAEIRLFQVEVQVPEERYRWIATSQPEVLSSNPQIRTFKIDPEAEFPVPRVKVILVDGTARATYDGANSTLVEKIKTVLPEKKGFPILDLNSTMKLRIYSWTIYVDFLFRHPIPNLLKADPFDVRSSVLDIIPLDINEEGENLGNQTEGSFKFEGSPSHRYMGNRLVRDLPIGEYLAPYFLRYFNSKDFKLDDKSISISFLNLRKVELILSSDQFAFLVNPPVTVEISVQVEVPGSKRDIEVQVEPDERIMKLTEMMLQSFERDSEAPEVTDERLRAVQAMEFTERTFQMLRRANHLAVNTEDEYDGLRDQKLNQLQKTFRSGSSSLRDLLIAQRLIAIQIADATEAFLPASVSTLANLFKFEDVRSLDEEMFLDFRLRNLKFFDLMTKERDYSRQLGRIGDNLRSSSTGSQKMDLISRASNLLIRNIHLSREVWEFYPVEYRKCQFPKAIDSFYRFSQLLQTYLGSDPAFLNSEVMTIKQNLKDSEDELRRMRQGWLGWSRDQLLNLYDSAPKGCAIQ